MGSFSGGGSCGLGLWVWVSEVLGRIFADASGALGKASL